MSDTLMPPWSSPMTSAPAASDPGVVAVCDSVDTGSSTMQLAGSTAGIGLSSRRRRQVNGLEDRCRAEEIEIHRLVGMPSDLLGDEPDAETWSIGDREVAVHDTRTAFDDRVAPVGVPGREHFLDERVRRDRVNHEGRCGRDRPVRVMRRYW